ncbi:hypothetical protein BRADI_4g07500v3 [Brachypodium distachyon]|uniref:SAM domain-containing protein n=2 Tax=Brachypodium distachyon TaxID=15368 RepID=A0A0Q3L2M6_BRADI|nr:hypothetical protein BRADI_4g07500v3 [Brachypodium distachyon]
MGDSPVPHRHPPSPHSGKRQRRPNVRLAGSMPFPSHLPHPRRIPIIPASRPRNRKPRDHNPSAAETPTHSNPTASDDLVLAAAFPRKTRVLEGEEEVEESEEGEVVDVAEWLWGMGMGRYVAAFEAHEVDGEVLPCLTMDDLRDMGIGAVGARRKLFHAIQSLQQPPLPPPPPRSTIVAGVWAYLRRQELGIKAKHVETSQLTMMLPPVKTILKPCFRGSMYASCEALPNGVEEFPQALLL